MLVARCKVKVVFFNPILPLLAPELFSTAAVTYQTQVCFLFRYSTAEAAACPVHTKCILINTNES